MAPIKDESCISFNPHHRVQLAKDSMMSDLKRRATDEPSTPSANKRVKSSHGDSPVLKKIPLPGNPIPFPEKVSQVYHFMVAHFLRIVLSTQNEALKQLTFTACSDRGAEWRNRVPCRQ